MNDHRRSSDDKVNMGLRSVLSWMYPGRLENHQLPSDEIIHAYVEGRASDQQVDAVEEAMLHSSEFMETIIMMRQVEEDFVEDAVIANLPDAGALAAVISEAGLIPAYEDDGQSDHGKPVEILRSFLIWLWRPHFGYGLAVALFGLMLFGRVGVDIDEKQIIPESLTVGLMPVDLSRSTRESFSTVLILPGTEAIDLVLAKSFPGTFLTEYHVVPELHRWPFGELVHSGGEVRPLQVLGDSVFLVWSIPTDLITSDIYQFTLTPVRADGEAVDYSEELISVFEVEDLRY